MKILLLNQNWFKEEFQEAGHEAISCGYSSGFDVRLESPLLHIDSVISLLPNNFKPDLIVWHDNSAPNMYLGLDETDIPCIFYSVDTQHHADLHTNLAHVFDHTFVAQRDYIPEFERNLVPNIHWLPLWASRYVEASSDKQYAASFIGTMNPRLNPARVEFFNALKELAPIHLDLGDFWKFFPFSEIVVNQTVKGDLNFRVFEGMMCGALMLTERTGNGLLDLFQEGTHLVTYEPNNPSDAANHIKSLLADIPRCRKIAAQGRDEILKNHLPKNRAEYVLEKISGITRTKNPQRFIGSMLNFSILSLPLEKKNFAACGKALIACLKAAEQALSFGERPNDLQTFYFIIGALRYDKLLQSTAGTEMIHRYAEAHPKNLAICLAKVRSLLNSGRAAEAKVYAETLIPADYQQTFRDAETLIAEFLKLVENYNPSLFPNAGPPPA